MDGFLYYFFFFCAFLFYYLKKTGILKPRFHTEVWDLRDEQLQCHNCFFLVATVRLKSNAITHYF